MLRAVGLALVLSGCAPLGAEVRSGFILDVSDEGGRRLCDAVVEVRHEGQRWLLGADGCRFHWLGGGRYELLVRATGYFSEQVVVELSEWSHDEQHRQVQLQGVDTENTFR